MNSCLRFAYFIIFHPVSILVCGEDTFGQKKTFSNDCVMEVESCKSLAGGMFNNIIFLSLQKFVV